MHDITPGHADPQLGQEPDPLWVVLERAVGAQYTVLRLLGRGGMGAVYLARERLLERLVAIKVLPREHADSDARERFLREARTAAQLSHPNIVPLLSFGELGDTLFYIMRYVDGESLEARLKRDISVPEPETRRVLSELCDALGYAHEQGVVHRDIKPDNVLIERGTGRVMLTDFGVARRGAGSGTLTGTGVVVGTPQYMSPEQASGERAIDGRADIYSVGVIAYRMITGRLPFDGGTARDLLMQHITRAPRHLAEIAPDAPADLAGAVMMCLAKEPAARWPDAAALRFAIGTSSVDSRAMPDGLESLPGLGTRGLMMSYVLLGTMGVFYLVDPDVVWFGVGLVTPAVLLVASVGGSLLAARRVGLSARKALRIAFWPPGWWPGWWPRTLRPPGDLWDRLPPVVRRARSWGLSVMIGAMFFGAVPGLLSAMIIALHFGNKPFAGVVMSVTMAATVLPLVSMAAVYIPYYRFGRRAGLTPIEVRKLADEPTAGSRFWERPAIARLLTDAIPDTAAPATPAGLLSAVREIVRTLPDNLDQLGSDALRAASDLASAIGDLDSESRQLADPADAGEQRRVEDRIAALGAESSDEPSGRRQMRSLLEGQLKLFRELEARRSGVNAKRAMLHEQLRTLWLQLESLRAQTATPTPGASELSNRIRELCRSIESRVEAAREAEQLTAQEGPSGPPPVSRLAD